MISEEKLAICKECPYSKKSKWFGEAVTTCGTLNLLTFPPVIGDVVMHEGKEIKLCGCVMNIKSLFELKCPADKW